MIDSLSPNNFFSIVSQFSRHNHNRQFIHYEWSCPPNITWYTTLNLWPVLINVVTVLFGLFLSLALAVLHCTTVV